MVASASKKLQRFAACVMITALCACQVLADKPAPQELIGVWVTSAPAYKDCEIEIKPHIPEDLTYVNASIKTVRGIISSNWKKDADSLTLEVTIPVNSTAKVSVPTMALKNIEVAESDAAVWKEGNFIKSSPGVTNATRTDDYITFNVGSGTYAFKLTSQN